MSNLFDELPGFIEEENQENERRAQIKSLLDQFYNMNVSGYAIDGCFKRITITPKIDINDIEKLIAEFPIILFSPLQKLFKIKKGLKIHLVFNGQFFHRRTEEFTDRLISSEIQTILLDNNIENAIREGLIQIRTIIEDWTNNDAYLTLVRLFNVKILIQEYRPIVGASYIQTPKYIANKKATINIKNEDNKCFKYCILYGLFSDKIKKDPQRINHYKKLENNYPNLLNFNNIPFPVKVEDVEKFCKQNENISVNVNKMFFTMKTIRYIH
jgi:hypothetical protein